jgi:hypothetical protein
MKANSPFAWLIAAFALLLGACNYDFPLTAKPTHKIDDRLLGDWASVDKDASKEEIMHVRRWDDSTYAVSMDNDIYRVFHSDFAGVAFVSVQDLNSDDRKYLYYRWSLTADGDRLTLQGVSDKIVPEKTKSAAAAQQLIKANLADPKLFGDELQFSRKKRSGR